MKVIIFGASGMVGQGILRECVLDSTIESVRVVGRSSVHPVSEKVQEILLPDVGELSSIEDQLPGYDACFFPLGVSSVGMSEEDYRRITYDLTLKIAGTLARLNPRMTFIYVSGSGTDSSEKGGSMWARVKGATENALLRLPFKAAYSFRPGVIQPLHGIRSKTKIYNAIYVIIAPLVGLARRLFPNHVVTTEQVGRAMIEVVKHGSASPLVEIPEIARLSRLQ